jgi:hypothetical protein
MAHNCPLDTAFPLVAAPQPTRLFARSEPPTVAFPIQSVSVDWGRLLTKRPVLLDTIDAMPIYLFKPEVLALLDAEKQPSFRLILDLMWSTGARMSEVLAITPSSFVDDGYNYGGILKTLKQGAGRPSKASLQRSPKRVISQSLTTRCKIACKATCGQGIFGKMSGYFRSPGKPSIDISMV